MFETYFEKHELYSRELNDKLNSSGEVVNTEFIRKEIRENDVLKEKISQNLDDALYTAKKDEARKKPIELLKSINDDIGKIDLTAISRLRGEDRTDFEEQMKVLKEKINNVEEKFNEII